MVKGNMHSSVNIVSTGTVLQDNHSHINKKICSHCDKPINIDKTNRKPALKALGKYFHEECFVCHDCSRPLRPKYFPFDHQHNGNVETLLLCQYDYFKRNALLCHVCDEPLRGLYFTAFGNRYDEEHFSCTICKTPCGVKKCFIHDDQLYCRFHFMKYFSKRCIGCKFPISDQYIEFPKGDQVLCWHPECYGIHKYWHVDLSSDTLNLPEIPKLEFNPTISTESNYSEQASNLDKQMQAFSFILNKTWSILYRFEEEAASCISDMFQSLTISDQKKGVEATALLVLKTGCLFKGLDSLNIFQIDTQQKDLPHTLPSYRESPDFKPNYLKLPKNLSKKLMIYLQFLRKLNQDDKKSSLNISLCMSTITGLAQYLKLLTRYGLHIALERNRYLKTVNPLMKFLKEVEKNEIFDSDPFRYINIPINTNDNCVRCQTYIQDECIQFNEYRWHLKCFSCNICSESIKPSDVTDATFNKEKKFILCSRCSVDDEVSVPGFKYVTNLSQLIFLLKIALVKTKTVMDLQNKDNKVANIYENGNVPSKFSMEQTYIRTLNDVKRLKSRRESIRVSNEKKEARKSVVLEIPETELGSGKREDKNLIIKTDTPTESSGRDEQLFGNNKTLTLDDISRIVAAEQARELRPNAFTHFKTLEDGSDEFNSNERKRTGVYYSELDKSALVTLKYISLSLLMSDLKKFNDYSFDFEKLRQQISREVRPSQNGNFWNKMWNIVNKDGKKSAPRKVFGTNLDDLSLYCGVDSELGVGPSKIRVPVLVDELISSLKQLDMSVEGIFRKNGNIRRLRELTNQIDAFPSRSIDFSKENAIQLSALLKKFLRELPDPLLTSDLYLLWISSAKISATVRKQKLFSLIFALLPLYNRNVLEVLLSFLNWTSSFSYIENEMGSKMDIHNLSTVIAPNILSSGLETPHNVEMKSLEVPADTFAQNNGENHFLAIEVIDFLITHSEDICMVPTFLMKLLEETKNLKLSTFEDINAYVLESLLHNKIDYSEFEIRKSPIVKNAVTKITRSSVLEEKGAIEISQ
ncbi:Rho-GTPase-activating protein LRG1 [Nakaseomyces glabratus]|nr:LIM domain profile [Nakaseomyces glabratus]KTB15477.1 Rho-GTPase-activating protein LRG1 [Nakaseomyces glabratus]KTB15521.1 Rho-GTPase-activating protein LRG1 [Nakaseomyces glabratus]OXB45052.1 hypothetical protein B1J91_C05599g [Nakaseomyces glabratus]OXB50349.1 hypothetical protein B1J92_C05599g [Nakaseomyces glabratus]